MTKLQNLLKLRQAYHEIHAMIVSREPSVAFTPMIEEVEECHRVLVLAEMGLRVPKHLMPLAPKERG